MSNLRRVGGLENLDWLVSGVQDDDGHRVIEDRLAAFYGHSLGAVDMVDLALGAGEFVGVDFLGDVFD